MGETKNATAGMNGATGLANGGMRRPIMGVAVIVVVLVVVLWFEWAMFRNVARLESTWHDGTRSDVSEAGALANRVSSMNDAVFRFQLTDDSAHRDQFHREAQRLEEELAAIQRRFGTNVTDAVAGLEQELARYRTEMAELTERGARPMRRETPSEVDQLIRERSRALEDAVDRLARVLVETPDVWVVEGQSQLERLRWMLIGSGAAMIGFVVVAGFQIYRGIMAPLRAELSQAQAAFIRQERLASVGELAAGVAHEIRNPLTALKFRLFSLRKALPPGFADHPDLGILRQEINRLERIVQDFLDFARPSDPVLARVSAGTLLEEVGELMRDELERRGIRVGVEASAAVEVRVDRHQLKQVLINLVRNASESMMEGGLLTMRVREGAGSWFQRRQAVVLMEVSDTGEGIPSEIEPKIFDPFYSTKEGGSGLGLSIAARIAELHGGHIQYATVPGRGTTFTIVLPKPE